MTRELRFATRPSPAAYMARAFLPGFLRRPGPFPPLAAVWQGHDSGGRELRELLELTGLADGGTLPITYPQVAGFPLQMALLTHPSFPVPIWGALQVRSRRGTGGPRPRSARGRRPAGKRSSLFP